MSKMSVPGGESSDAGSEEAPKDAGQWNAEHFESVFQVPASIDKEISITLKPQVVIVLEGVCSAGKDKAEKDDNSKAKKKGKKSGEKSKKQKKKKA